MLHQKLRFIQWNVENLFLFMENHNGEDIRSMTEKQWQNLSRSTVRNKPLSKCIEMQKIINELRPDFLFLNEIGGPSAINNFNRFFLENNYTPYLIEGNSDRGIDVGFLVNKELPYKYLHISHKNKIIPLKYDSQDTNSYYFSRDVSELRVIDPKSKEIIFILLSTHLKSQLDPQGIDPSGIIRRTAEVEALTQIYNQINDEFQGKMPVMLAGDFNGIAKASEYQTEFSSLHKETDLKATMDVLSPGEDLRTTRIQFTRNKPPVRTQIDYIFLSPHWHKHINSTETYVYRYKGRLPESIQDTYKMPSDHMPVVLTVGGK